MTDWYEGARNHKFHPEFVEAGIVSQEQADQASDMWYEGCQMAHLLTENMYDSMTTDQRKKVGRGINIWGGVGGIRVASGGYGFTLFKSVEHWIQRIAETNARERRKDMGWKDDGSGQYLIDPEGNTAPPRGNGQPYGRFSTPSRSRDLGPWDGVITDDTRFTK